MTSEREQSDDPDAEPVDKGSPGVHNTASGVVGSTLQAGTVHGDVHLNPAAEPGYQVTVHGGQGAVIGDYATVFQTFTAAPVPLSSHVRVVDFRSTVEDRTREFVGREFVFTAIDRILQDKTFPSGYVVLRGEPGIGKTAVLAQLIKQRGVVHHFNIAPLGIRSPQAFLGNVCAQLIIRYGLGHTHLPDTATQDGGFLARLLSEAAADPANLPILIVVDALDEAEDGSAGGPNRLCLPPNMPPGVHFLVSTREQHDSQFYADARRDIYLRDDDPLNLADVHDYVESFVRGHPSLAAPTSLVDVLVERSEGNFMYVVHVLRDLLSGALDMANLSTLPQGLRAYYRKHWDVMKAHDPEFFRRYQAPAVCLLATAREPVTAAQTTEWITQHWTDAGWGVTDLDTGHVLGVIRQWQEFLNTEGEGANARYRIYHASFQDFLREEIGLEAFHAAISSAALAKIPGFRLPG